MIMMRFRGIDKLKFPPITRKVKENALQGAKWIFGLKMPIFDVYVNQTQGIVIDFNDHHGRPHKIVFEKGFQGDIGQQQTTGEIYDVTSFKSSKGLQLKLYSIAKS